MIVLTIAKNRLKAGKVRYNALIIGGDKNAVELYDKIVGQPYMLGLNFRGFIDANGNSSNHLSDRISLLGTLNEIPEVMEEYEIEEVIIAIEENDHSKMKFILDSLYDTDERVLLKIIPDM